jgi:putative endonuclease
MKREWFLYIIETENGSFYTGITTDLERRFSEHSGKSSGSGAKFFNRSAPKKIRYQLAGLDHSMALKIEHGIKKLKRQEKMKMIECGYDIHELKLLLRL